MKYLKSYNLYEKTEKEYPSNIFDNINIYDEIDLIKSKNRESSIIYNYMKDYYGNSDINVIVSKCMNFFKIHYPNELLKYKEDHKIYKSKGSKKRLKNIKIDVPIKGSNDTLKMPGLIGHLYKPVLVLPMSDLKFYKEHKRLKVFYYKGLKCANPKCDEIGKYLIKTVDNVGGTHIDVYTKDFKLMTVDHILPKSKGGTYDLENLDPMCMKCNTKKGNKEDYYEFQNTKKQKTQR